MQTQLKHTGHKRIQIISLLHITLLVTHCTKQERIAELSDNQVEQFLKIPINAPGSLYLATERNPCRRI
jgi:hypothetical protein